jgi:hypothetical protein
MLSGMQFLTDHMVEEAREAIWSQKSKCQDENLSSMSYMALTLSYSDHSLLIREMGIIIPSVLGSSCKIM